jgi:porin
MRQSLLIAFALAGGVSTASAAETLEPRPTLSLESVYTAEGWHLRADDLRSHTVYLDNLDLTATLDGEALFGVGGLQFFAYALYYTGHALDGVDTVQGVSNIESVRALRLYEAWAQAALGPFASLRAGLYDLNSEFDAIDSAALFINPSHGIGPDFSQSGENGPSIFPSTSLALRLQLELGQWQARVALLDAIPGDPNHPENTTVRWSSNEGFLYVAEVDYSLNGRVRTGLGVWQYSEPVDGENNDGAYAFAETGAIELANERGFLNVFTRTGWADEDVNPVSRYVGAGISWTGFVADRADRVGVAIAHATMSDPWRRAMADEGATTRAAETILELTARFPFGDSVALQPDVQYIRHPGATADRDSAWVFGLRLEVGASYER